MRGRKEAAARGGEAAEVDSVIVAGVVLHVTRGAAQQPQQPLCGKGGSSVLGEGGSATMRLVPARSTLPSHLPQSLVTLLHCLSLS